MKIGIIGAGKIGATIANLFIKAGHAVALSNSRGPESLKELITSLGDNAIALSVNEAAAFGDIVFLATPWRETAALPDAITVQDKIVIDAMNPYLANGKLADLGNSTSSEETAKRLPGATIVKAFNTIHYQHLNNSSEQKLPLQERRAIFMASDSIEAKAKVSRLIEEIGFAAIDTGNLRDGGQMQQPGSELYNKEITCADAHDILKKDEA
ncbi:NAD(P)-binding domain-containing protein [Mucilaginibacter sp. HMF5004]|uniref:NADPH-dependent F420 reductase n=1 Tax=Mucilaginibacter rivuli TaxID=2857527 RepID=UPI001C5E2E79|nr:NAD(P)-binding domain-containing protein [Mucilaginibacter rivuli]MBW4889413.1 NAD(P)-binding domain-containing protein [Mucilaginibacter rivuli]